MNTTADFRQKHTKGFLKLFHPNVVLDHEVLLRMEKESSATRIYSEEFKKK